MAKKKDLISKPTVRLTYKLSPSWIDRLGEPDRKASNWRNPKGSRVQLWERSRVEMFIEQNRDEYDLHLKKREVWVRNGHRLADYMAAILEEKDAVDDEWVDDNYDEWWEAEREERREEREMYRRRTAARVVRMNQVRAEFEADATRLVEQLRIRPSVNDARLRNLCKKCFTWNEVLSDLRHKDTNFNVLCGRKGEFYQGEHHEEFHVLFCGMVNTRLIEYLNLPDEIHHTSPEFYKARNQKPVMPVRDTDTAA